MIVSLQDGLPEAEQAERKTRRATCRPQVKSRSCEPSLSSNNHLAEEICRRSQSSRGKSVVRCSGRGESVLVGTENVALSCVAASLLRHPLSHRCSPALCLSASQQNLQLFHSVSSAANNSVNLNMKGLQEVLDPRKVFLQEHTTYSFIS